MVNGDHGNMQAETNAADDVHVDSSTQDEIIQEDLCVATQQEINFAELRYQGSLLQEAFPDRVIKVPLPTTAQPDVVVFFGRQTNDAPAHQLFVKLYDRSRGNKQPASRFHSLLRLKKEAAGDLSASIQDLHQYPSRYTKIEATRGRQDQMQCSDPRPLYDGCIIHFCPRVPRLPQEDTYEEYAGFKFSFHCPLMLEDGGPVREAALATAEPSQRVQLKLVVASVLIGGLMGTGGSTIRNLQSTYQATIRVSGQRHYHPDAKEGQGRVIHCAAHNQASLHNALVAIIESLFPHQSGVAGNYSLAFVVPLESMQLLTESGLDAMRSATRTQLRLRDPHPYSPNEQLLTASGPLSTVSRLLTSLLATCPQPLTYRAELVSDQVGESPPSALDLPLSKLVQRYKKKAIQDRGRAAKRGKISRK
jgi:hypothetical protein